MASKENSFGSNAAPISWDINLDNRPTAGLDSVMEPANFPTESGNQMRHRADEIVPNVVDRDLHQVSLEELSRPDYAQEDKQEGEEDYSFDDPSDIWAELDERDEGPTVPPRCTICWEPLDESPPTNYIRLDCREYYCVGCLNAAFEFSLRHEANFPLLCGCKLRVRMGCIHQALTPALLKKYEALAPEWTSRHRTYCANCLQYVDAKPYEDQEMYSVCASCGEWTCRKCKASKARHDDACPPDPDRQKLLKLITDKKWKQCGNCGNFIEKADGCSDMMCICGYHFCYACGQILDDNDDHDCGNYDDDVDYSDHD